MSDTATVSVAVKAIRHIKAAKPPVCCDRPMGLIELYVGDLSCDQLEALSEQELADHFVQNVPFAPVWSCEECNAEKPVDGLVWPETKPEQLPPAAPRVPLENSPAAWPEAPHRWWWMRFKMKPRGKWRVLLVELVNHDGTEYVQPYDDRNCFPQHMCIQWDAMFLRADGPPKVW